MSQYKQFKDILFLFVDFVTYKDILHLSSTCNALRSIIFNADFWKRLLYLKYKSDLWINITFEDVFEPARLLFQYQYDNSVIDQFLKHKYIIFRLSEPQSSKNHLKFYAKIETPSLPDGFRQELLVGNIIDSDDVNQKLIYPQSNKKHLDCRGFYLRFKKLNGQSAYFWNGEENHKSSVIFYLLDRKVVGCVTDIKSENVRTNFQNSILGKKDYKVIGKMLHNDENHYQDFKSTSYNHVDSHSSQRFRTERFGENTNSTSYQNIGVSCITHIDAFIPTDYTFLIIKK